MSALAVLAETDWLMFIGRLHPLVVHLPIGMLAALVIVESMTILRNPEKVTATRKLLVMATAISAIAAVVAGWFLGDEGGYPKDLIFWHRWLGIGFAGVLFIGAVIAMTPRWSSVIVRLAVLGLAAGLMTVTGHLGGTMTHGETYLTRYAPPLVARLLGAPTTEDAPPAVISEEVESDALLVRGLFERRCYECHGSTKQKGNLRLDTPEGIASSIFAGDPAESELFRRISLARDDFDIMPPEGEPLTDAEVLSVMRWIRDGAEVAPVEVAPTVEDQKPAPEAQLIGLLRSEHGASVTEFPGTGELTIDFSLGEGSFQASTLTELTPIAERVVEISLAGRTISGEAGDASFPMLARLRLERSNADDAFVQAMLERAPNLETLNLHSTAVTDDIVDAIVNAPSLREINLFGTALSTDALRSLRNRRPGMSVEAGEELADAFVVSGGPREILAADYSANRIALMREVALGHPVTLWEHEVGDIHDLHVLPSGNILFQTSWTKLIEVNPNTDEAVWSYDASVMNRDTSGERVEVHAFERRPDGSTMIAESGPARIIEVDREGKLLSSTPLTVDKPDPHHDTRLVRTTPDGTYLVAHESDGVAREYDKEGNIVWSYTVPTSWTDPDSGKVNRGDGNALFSAVRLENGNTLIGTGNGHGVLEVDQEGTIVWSVCKDDIEGVTLAWVTTVQRLSNGNTVIGNCHAGEGQPQIIEITPGKELVWKFHDFERFGNALSNSFVTEDTHGGP